MAKESQQERQLRVAREGLARGLASSNADEAVQHVLQLPPGVERDAALPAVARLARVEVARALAGQKWDRVGFFAARVARESRLASEGATPAETADANWALLWGSIKGKVWPRAEAHLASLRSVLPPPLAESLQLIIAHQGAPPPNLRGAIPEPPAPDPRLGYDPRRTSPVELAPPQQVAEVEERVMALFATRDWASFSEGVERWAEAAPAGVQQAIHAQAAMLSIRELLKRKGDGVFAPATYVARRILAAGSPPQLVREQRLALSRVIAALPQELHQREPLNALAAVVRSALAYPELRSLAQGLLPGIRFGEGLREGALDLLGLVYAASPSAALIWKALRVAGVNEDPAFRIPKWLLEAIEAQLANPEALGAAIGVLARKERSAGIRSASNLLPVPLAEKLFDRLWDGADPETREELGLGLGELVDRERQVPSGPIPQEMLTGLMRSMAREQGMDLDSPEIQRLLRSPEGIEGLAEAMAELGGGELTRAGQELFRRHAARLTPRGVGLLELALEVARTPAERDEAVRRFWEGNPEPRARLRALVDAVEDDLEEVVDALHRQILAVHAGDGPFLTRALASAWANGMDRRWVTSLCEAVSRAAANRAWRQTAEEANLVLRAGLHLGSTTRRPRRTQSRRSKASAKRKPLPPPTPWVPGSPFDPPACLARFGQFLEQYYSGKTANVYLSQVRRVFQWLEAKGRLKALRSQRDLINGANEYLHQLHAQGKPGGGVATAMRAFERYLWSTRELG